MRNEKIQWTCVISNWGTWGNVNLEKNEKEGKIVILKFEILPLIVPLTYYLGFKPNFSS